MLKKLFEIKKFRIYTLCISVVYILCMLFAGLYQFSNQELKLDLYLGADNLIEKSSLDWANDPGEIHYARYMQNKGILEYTVEVWQAKEGGSCSFSFTTDDSTVTLDKLIIYRNKIKVAEIKYTEMQGYIKSFDGLTSGDLAVSNMLFLDQSGRFEIEMADSFNQLLYSKSASFMQERIISMLFATIIFIILFISGIVYTFQKNRDTLQRLIENQNDKGIIAEIVRFAMDFKKYWYYMIYSAKSDLKAEVANSYLNWIWWLLEPFCNMLVYVIVFGNFMGNNIQNYAVFVFSALLMWNFFNKTINYSVKAVRNNKDIVSKVYVPKFVILMSNIFLNIFKFLFSLIVLALMLMFFKVQINANILWILLIYFELILFSFGLGMVLLHFGVFVDDLSYAVSILISMLMFLSGIFYDVNTTLIEPLNKIMLYLNPVAMLINSMRIALIDGRCPDLILIGIWFIVSLAISLIGIHIVYKNENSYVKVV